MLSPETRHRIRILATKGVADRLLAGMSPQEIREGTLRNWEETVTEVIDDQGEQETWFELFRAAVEQTLDFLAAPAA